jgi:hypothetical protein
MVLRALDFAVHWRVLMLQCWQGLLTTCSALPVSRGGGVLLCQQLEFLLFLLYGLDSRDNVPMRDLISNHTTHEDPRIPFDLVSHGI